MFTAKKSSALGLEKSMTGAARNLSPVYYKTGHGFVSGQALYYSGSGFGLAQANSAATSNVMGFVSKSEGADRFALTISGEVTLKAANFVSGSLPAAGTMCYLSDTVAGKLQTTKPAVSWDVKPIVTILSVGATEAAGLFISDWSPSNLNFGIWTGSTYYAEGAIVRQVTVGYEGYWRAVSGHTSTSTWSNDFNSGYWELVTSWMGNRIVVGNTTSFTVGQIVYISAANTYTLARADVIGTARAVGMVVAKTTNKFILGLPGSSVAGLSLTAASRYYLSPVTAGSMTTTIPTTTNQFVVGIGTAINTTDFLIEIDEPRVIGTASLDTISENTLNAGVTADGVLLKDSQVYTDQINEKTLNAGVTADGVKFKDSGIIQDSAVTRKSGFSDAIVANTLYKIGTMTMGANSRHVMLKGFLWVYNNATIEFNVFIRSNTLPAKNVYYYTVEYQAGQDISIEVWDDPLSDAVHIGFKATNSSFSARWEVTEIGRSLYDGWINATTMTVLATAGLTQISESGTVFHQVLEQFSGGIKTETISPITSTNSVAFGGTTSQILPVGTTSQRPNTPTDGMTRYNSDLDTVEFYSNGGWEVYESTYFRLKGVAGSSGTISGGVIILSNGDMITTGSGTTEAGVGGDITLNLSTILGSSPANATIYYLYVDRFDLELPYTLTDSGRKVIRAYSESHFALLTTEPAASDLYRYVPVGYVRSATTGNAWTGTGASYGFPRFSQHAMFDFVGVPERYSTTLNTAAVHVLSHGFSQKPQIVQLFYWNGTDTVPLNPTVNITDVTAQSLEIDTTGLVFGSGEYVSVFAYGIPTYSNQIVSNVTQFRSGWFEDTLTTTIPHGLSDAEDIKGYSVVEWNVTTGRYTIIPSSSLIQDYDGTNLYLNWGTLTPSSTLKYQIVTGGTPIPASLPIYFGGFTKFVGAGPGSYPTITAALAASVSGDSILVVTGYSINTPETVNVNDVKIMFVQNAKITQVAAQKGLIISASGVSVQDANYVFSGAGTVASFLEISGDDVIVDKIRVVLNNAGTTVTDGFVFTTTAERGYVNGSVKTIAGTISNMMSDLGTDNDYAVRG